MKVNKEYFGLKRVTVEFSEHEIKETLIEKALRVVDLPSPPPGQAVMERWVDGDENTGKLVIELVWTYRADIEEEGKESVVHGCTCKHNFVTPDCPTHGYDKEQ